jgi:hypothetical protein
MPLCRALQTVFRIARAALPAQYGSSCYRPTVAFFALVLQIFAGQVSAGESESDSFRWLDVSGSFQSTYRQSVHNKKPLNAVQRIQLQAEVNKDGMLRGFASGYIDADFAVYSRKDSEERVLTPDLHEAYFTVDTRHFDIIAGLQQIHWGEADSLGTFDIINPVDYRNPFDTARSSRRLSVGAVDLRTDLGGIGLFDVVVIPFPRFSRLPEHNSPWEEKALKTLRDFDDAGLITLDDARGRHSPEIAARLKFFRQGYDFAFLFYSGYEHEPRYSTSIDLQNFQPKVTVTSSYERYTAYGFNTAVSFWESTLHGEFTVKPSYPFQSYLPGISGVERRTDYETIVGWDRDFFTSLHLNVQVFLFAHDGKKVPGEDRNRYGYTWSVSDKFLDDALTTGVRGEVFAQNNDLCIEFFSEYEYDDHLKFTLGYFFFDGKPENELGQFRQNDHIYMGFKYSF